MRRRGVILIAVLVMTLLAAMLAAGLLFRVRGAVAAADSLDRGQQARLAAMSGIRRAMEVLRDANDPDVWYDAPDLFADQLVADDGADRWYFTVHAPDPADPGRVRNGLEDEAARINLNQADANTLLSLPGLNTELVDALLDYLDGDNDARPRGAEQDSYDRLPAPYVIKNGPLETVEELLLVKGFRGPLVFGEDFNLNGLLDATERDADETFPPDNDDSTLDRGLRALVTVFTREGNLDSQGRPRIDINGDPNALEGIGLDQPTVEFIRLCRLEGHVFKDPIELLELKYTLKEDHATALASGPAGQTIEADLDDSELAVVCDRLMAVADATARDPNADPNTVDPNTADANTTDPNTADPNVADANVADPNAADSNSLDANVLRPGRVNVNTASPQVLAAIGAIGESRARSIVDKRSSISSETKANLAWLYTQDVLDANEFKAAAGMLTTRSWQYRVTCVGFGVPCGRMCRLEAVIDLSGGQPRIIYLRDITRLGVPFDVAASKQ